MVVFDHVHTKIIELTFRYCEFAPVWKKWLYFICSFLSPLTRLATHIFDHVNPKHFWAAFNFCDHVSTYKKWVYSICPFFRYSQFSSPFTRLGTPIFYHAYPKIFNHLLICVKLYGHAKNQFHQFLLEIQSISESRNHNHSQNIWD